MHDANMGHFAQSGHPHALGIEITTAVFALLSGIAYLSHHLLLSGRPLHTLFGLENRAYWKLLLIGILVVVGESALQPERSGFESSGAAVGPLLRFGGFQCASLLSGAGFTTGHLGDRMLLPAGLQVLLGFMFVGGCLGSTAGGLKILRIAVLWRLVWHEIKRFTYPRSYIMPFTIERRQVPAAEVERIVVLAFCWVAVIALGSIVIALLSGLGGLESFTVALSAVSNMGPSLISPAEMAAFGPVLKLFCILLMIAGRLELLPVLALLSKSVWR